MQNLVIKIVKALSKIEHEKGPFIVKCLVARNPDDIQWDLVLAANWFDEDRIQRLNYLSKKVLCDFDSDTISQFSGIIAISPDSQLAQFLKKYRMNINCILENGMLVNNVLYKPIIIKHQWFYHWLIFQSAR